MYRNTKIVLAKQSDLELILAWRSHPTIYHFFRIQKKPLFWDEHINFWKKRKNRVDFIIKYKAEDDFWRKVGTINISHLEKKRPEIGILIGELTLQGKGVGYQALCSALEWLRRRGYRKAFAEVHKNNIASNALFAKAGFVKCSKSGLWNEYVFIEGKHNEYV